MIDMTGGCLCGRIRYRCTAEPIDSGYCHCRMCQRLSGAPALTWATIRLEDFAYIQGAPTVFRSSPNGERRFCPTCGAQIEFRPTGGARTVAINTGTLDEPADAPPRRHIFCDSRVPWFDTADALPRFPGDG
jgi:hypothetical protein